MLIVNIAQTYRWIDDALIEILYKDIPKDLDNPNVTFYTLREKSIDGKIGKLLALCKISKKVDGSIYWGTHYVEEDYRGNYWIGSYIAKLAFKDFENYDIDAIVSKNNPSLEAQVNYTDFVWTQMVTDQAHGMESDLMVWIRLFRNKVFQTKDKQLYPDIKFKNSLWNHWNYEVVLVDSRFWYDQKYIETLQQKFSQWYALTRLFYWKKWRRANLEETYMVFENITQ
jgi:hypothetical protein